MKEKEWLDLLHAASQIYNNERMHRDFQADEVNKFVDWMYAQYGFVAPNVREVQ